MSSGVVFKGTKGPQLMRDEWQSDPSVGWNVEREWCGEKSVIMGYVNAFNVARVRCRHRHDGPLHYVTAFYTYPDNSSLFTEKWSAQTISLEKDGFFHPTVNAEMEAYAAATGQQSEYRKELEQSITNGENPTAPLNTASYPISRQMFLELRRGAVSYETEYLRIQRTRIVPRQFGATMVIVPTSYVFSAAQLPFPSDINFSIGVIPTAPVQTVWGFRRTEQSCDWASDRIEMTVAFVLAAWSTLYYEQSSGNFIG